MIRTGLITLEAVNVIGYEENLNAPSKLMGSTDHPAVCREAEAYCRCYLTAYLSKRVPDYGFPHPGPGQANPEALSR